MKQEAEVGAPETVMCTLFSFQFQKKRHRTWWTQFVILYFISELASPIKCAFCNDCGILFHIRSRLYMLDRSLFETCIFTIQKCFSAAEELHEELRRRSCCLFLESCGNRRSQRALENALSRWAFPVVRKSSETLKSLSWTIQLRILGEDLLSMEWGKRAMWRMARFSALTCGRKFFFFSFWFWGIFCLFHSLCFVSLLGVLL